MQFLSFVIVPKLGVYATRTAHDASVSLFLDLLQIAEVVRLGMGIEVVVGLYYVGSEMVCEGAVGRAGYGVVGTGEDQHLDVRFRRVQSRSVSRSLCRSGRWTWAIHLPHLALAQSPTQTQPFCLSAPFGLSAAHAARMAAAARLYFNVTLYLDVTPCHAGLMRDFARGPEMLLRSVPL